jgi:hypothetical protein
LIAEGREGRLPIDTPEHGMTSAKTLAAVAVASLLTASAARACDPVMTECLPAVVVFPAVTPEGVRVGTVEAPVRRVIPFERSRFTGLPLTVVYNDPARWPAVVDPIVELVPLPRPRRLKITRLTRRVTERLHHARCR